MKGFIRRAGTALIAFGFDPRRTLSSLRFCIGYVADLIRWMRRCDTREATQFPLRLLPTLSDKYIASGVASGHYFHQDLWAARCIYRVNPRRHVDVGSRIDGFISHLLTFREVEVIDVRPLQNRIEGLVFHRADLMSDQSLPVEPSESVSCLHALEHFGLGRYGDPVTPGGWRIGLRRLADLVSVNGCLYLSVPIGEATVEFNAQRIFRAQYILDEARLYGLVLKSFSFVDDDGDFHNNVDISEATLTLCDHLQYGCGCFLFEKQAMHSSSFSASHRLP